MKDVIRTLAIVLLLVAWNAQASVINNYVRSTPQPIVILSVEDCDGNKEWLVGGVLQNWKAAEVGINGYQWIWVEKAQEAATVASTWFYQGVVITHTISLPPSECADAAEEAGIYDSISYMRSFSLSRMN